jgi:hypothetical protein
MVMITFPDRETERQALAFLLDRFSGRRLGSGEHLVPEAAMEALAAQNIEFTVKGKATYEQQVAEPLHGQQEIEGMTSDQPPSATAEVAGKGRTEPRLPDQVEVDEGNAASIALLESWLEEEATDDPEEIRQAQQELDEFKRAINAERERAGARRIYP